METGESIVGHYYRRLLLSGAKFDYFAPEFFSEIPMQRLLIIILMCFWGAVTLLQAQQIKIQSGHATQPFSLSYDRHCDCYAAGYHDQIRIFDRSTQVELATLSGHMGEIRGLQFSPNGRYLLSFGGSTLVLWDTKTWKEIWFSYTPSTMEGEAYHFSGDNKYLAYGQYMGNKTTLQLLELTTLKEETLYTTEGLFDALAFDNQVERLFFTIRSKYYLSNFKDTTVAYVDLISKKTLQFIENPNMSKQIHFIDFDAEDNLIIAGEDLVIWNLKKRIELLRVPGVQSKNIKISADKKYIVYNNGLKVNVVDLSTKEIIDCDLKIQRQLINDFLIYTDPSPLVHFITEHIPDTSQAFQPLKINNVYLDVNNCETIIAPANVSNNVTFLQFLHHAPLLLSAKGTSKTFTYRQNYSNQISVWSLLEAKMAMNISFTENRIVAMENNENDHLLVAGLGSIGVYDLKTGRKLGTTYSNATLLEHIEDVEWIDTSRFAVVSTTAVTSGIYDRYGKYMEPFYQFKEHQHGGVFRIKAFSFFSENPQSFAHLAYPDQVYIHKNGKTESILSSLNPEALSSTIYYNDLTGNKNKGLIAYLGNRGQITLRDMLLNKTKKIKGVYPFVFNSSGTLFAYEYDGNIEIRDLDRRYKVTHRFPSLDHLDVMAFSPDAQFLAASGLDGLIKIFDLNQDKELITFIGLSDDGYISIVDNKYYYSSTEDIQQSVFYVYNDNIYPFEQFDLKYNRPDIVIERMGLASSTLVDIYKKAYQKRLRQMRFTEDMLSDDFHAPIIDVEWPSFLITKDSTISFKVHAQDSLVQLDRLDIYINGVPLFGSNGRDLRPLRTNELKDTIQVNLHTGKNVIQASVYNQAGAVSTRETYSVNYISPINANPDLYLVAIGVDHYDNAEYNLKYPVKDLEDISTLFKENAGYYENTHIIKLYNEDVNLKRIKEVKEQLMGCKIDDKVIVVISGHGLIDDQLNYYLATSATAFDKIAQTAIPFNVLENILDSIPARSKVLFMDACHAGEVDKESMDVVKEQNSIQGPVSFRSLSNSINIRQIDEVAAYELMKSIFVDLRKGTGATIIASASAYEFAFEGDQWNNSVFAYALLEGLKSKQADKDLNGQVMISELHEYLHNRVSKLTGGLQRPTPRIENPINDWRIW
ncbi:MAG: caspase family protein [Saprospiraceae bacterium]|nr:caspase family protein [Saprospiraceae bacterium]